MWGRDGPERGGSGTGAGGWHLVGWGQFRGGRDAWNEANPVIWGGDS